MQKRPKEADGNMIPPTVLCARSAMNGPSLGRLRNSPGAHDHLRCSQSRTAQIADMAKAGRAARRGAFLPIGVVIGNVRLRRFRRSLEPLMSLPYVPAVGQSGMTPIRSKNRSFLSFVHTLSFSEWRRHPIYVCSNCDPHLENTVQGRSAGTFGVSCA